jgi:hypothetical protein
MERTHRIAQLVTNQINDRKVELVDMLEKLINNNDEPIGVLKIRIMDVLKQIADIDSTGAVWESYLPSIINNNSDKKEE